MTVSNILTFDVEDNFTIDELVLKSDWNKYEGQVVKNTETILILLEKYNVKATFFVLGKIAERRPEVCKMISEAGHETASHGYIHKRVSDLGMNGFADDVIKSKNFIESVTGKPLKGFRAMAFSITTETAWALNILKDLGFAYDSSVLSNCFSLNADYFKTYFTESFHEISPSSTMIFGREMTYGGGLMFRLAPYSVISSMLKKENKAGRPVVFYAHAWEFNKDQPQRSVGFLQSVAQSPSTFNTSIRIEKFIQEFSFTSIEEYLKNA